MTIDKNKVMWALVLIAVFAALFIIAVWQFDAQIAEDPERYLLRKKSIKP